MADLAEDVDQAWLLAHQARRKHRLPDPNL